MRRVPSVVRHIIRGCGELDGFGAHPGTAPLIGFGVLMVGAGGVVVGLSAWAAMFLPLYLIGAYSRSVRYERAALAPEQEAEP